MSSIDLDGVLTVMEAVAGESEAAKLLRELKRFRAREPLVTALIECAFECDGNATHKAAERVRDFEPK